MRENFKRCFAVFGVTLALCTFAVQAQQTKEPAEAAKTTKSELREDPKARAILNAVKAKLRGIKSLVYDYEGDTQPFLDMLARHYASPTQAFKRTAQISMERPNKFRIEKIEGFMREMRWLQAVSDGRTVIRYDRRNYVSYEKPVHPESFYRDQNLLMHFFFGTSPLGFDPADDIWGRPLNQFENNKAAYDKDVQISYLGERTLEGLHLRVVEIKYNTPLSDVRMQICVGDDDLIYQVDPYVENGGNTFAAASQKFRNFRINAALDPKTWEREIPPKLPVIKTDPIRIGQMAPEFHLPGTDGKEYDFKQLLQGKKAMYVVVFDAYTPREMHFPDLYLQQMRLLQQMKDRYEKQGLVVVAITGHPNVTPEMKEEVILNGLPDLKRFNYPVLLDFDVERGLQGSAFEDFQIGGRNNILIDGKGRVVYASNNFDQKYTKVNQLALFHALAALGFEVSPAELEGATYQEIK